MSILRHDKTVPPDLQDDYIANIDEKDEDDDGSDDASGTSPVSLSLPDQSPRADLISAIVSGVREALELERKHYQNRRQGFIENQAGGQISCTKFAVPNNAIQICREKPNRSKIEVTLVVAEGQVWFGTHVGISPNGTDIATIFRSAGVGPSTRTFDFTGALWAISNDPAGVMIDVVETFV